MSAAVTSVVNVAATYAVVAFPLGMGLGILRYRLFEIDRIISRTVAYALVTGLLVGVYAGLVLLAIEVLRLGSSVAVAVATLAAAALFSPLRRRVQRQVDRRFNRARYDADAAVAAFNVQLKDAVDMTAVQADLVRVVHDTLGPAHMSVWMQRPGSGARSGFQVAEHGQHPPVVVPGWRQAQLREDAGHVLFDHARGDDEGGGDPGVGPPFGHQRQHFMLARRQPGESGGVLAGPD
jgi:hypothetical protein